MKSFSKQSWSEAPDPKLAVFLQIPCPKQANQTRDRVCCLQSSDHPSPLPESDMEERCFCAKGFPTSPTGIYSIICWQKRACCAECSSLPLLAAALRSQGWWSKQSVWTQTLNTKLHVLAGCLERFLTFREFSLWTWCLLLSRWVQGIYFW